MIRNVHHEDDDSPEPSPVQPPNPQHQHVGSPVVSIAMPKWTPHSHVGSEHFYRYQHTSDGMIDDESLPPVPNVPSPYSPPPSSLFSGEEFPVKSTRKKNLHSGLDRSGFGRRLSLNDVSNHQPIPTKINVENEQHEYPKSLEHQWLPLVHSLKNDLHESQTSMHLLQQENKALSNECDRFQRELGKWQQAAQASVTMKEETLESQISELHNELLSARESYRELQLILEASDQKKLLLAEELKQDREIGIQRTKELESTTAEMEKSKKRVIELQQELLSARESHQESQLKVQEDLKQLPKLVEANSQLSKDLEIATVELDTCKKSINCNTSEKEQLQSALADATERENKWLIEKQALKAEIGRLRKTSLPKTPMSELSKQPNVFTFEAIETEDGSKNGGLISERLGRIRDAAERAAMAKEYRKEWARLKAEHDADIKRLNARHEQDLRDVIDETKSEVTARARETRRRLQNEYDTKATNLERRYQNEIVRMQRECDQNTVVAEEAMQAAASEVSTIVQQLEEETANRETLEGTVRDLERKIVLEQNLAQSKLSAEWRANHQKWQSETHTLISSIQQECNTAFEQNLARSSNMSPCSVVNDAMSPSSVLNHSDFPIDDHDVDNDFAHKTPWKPTKKTSYQSPLDVSHALDETEALVRSLVGH